MSNKIFGNVDWRGIILCLIVLALLSPLIHLDLVRSREKPMSYHSREDVDSTLQFLDFIEDSDVVVPQGSGQDILMYAGVDLSQLIANSTLLQRLYSAKTLEEFSQIILSKYPNASRAQIFMIERRIGNEYYPLPSLEMLELWGEKCELGSVVFYTMPLPLSIKKPELLESAIDVQLPAGRQWVKINVTGTDLSAGEILTLRILNNNNASKKFFARIHDTKGNSTEQILFTLQSGDGFYYIRLTEIEEVVDLSNPATLILCFSWYEWEPSIDLTISNIILASLED